MTVVAELVTELGFDIAPGQLSEMEQAFGTLGTLLGKIANNAAEARADMLAVGRAQLDILQEIKAAQGGPQGGPAKELEATNAAGRTLLGTFEALRFGAAAFLSGEIVQRVQAFAHEMMDLSSEAGHAATRLGITTDAYQELKYAATDADVSQGALTNGLRTLQIQLAGLEKGSKSNVATFRELGLSAGDLAGQGADEALGTLADALSEIADPAKRAALAQQVFGRASTELLPLLAEGSDGLRELREEARALGGGLGGETIEAAGELEKQTKKLDFAMLGLRATIGTAVLPWMSRLAEIGQHLAAGFVDLEKRTGAFSTALSLGAFAGAVKTLQALGGALKGLQFAGLGKQVLALGAAFLLVNDAWNLLKGGESVIGQWIDSWAGLGTVDRLVRNIAAGLKQIRELGYGASLKEAVSGVGEANKVSDRQRMSTAKLEAAQQVYGKIVADKSQPQAYRDYAANKLREAEGAAFGDTLNTPRAIGRGLDANIEALDSGRANVAITGENKTRRDDTGKPVNLTTNVTVNATTGADAKQIGKEAAKATVRAQAQAMRFDQAPTGDVE